MGAPTKKADTVRKVREYLRSAVTEGPAAAPITYSAIERATGIDRRTIKKWMAKEVDEARRQQAVEQKSAREREEEAYREQLREKDARIEGLKGENANLLERLTLMEGNARRLGIDPDELYRPLETPDRSLPRTGTKGGRGAKAG